MIIVFPEACLEYESPGHPESPARLKEAYKLLSGSYSIISPENACEDDLLAVHSARLIQKIKSLDFYDHDSPAYDDLYYYASLAAGSAIKAMQSGGFSLARPPGHHAGRDFLGGFCYFNNLAVAVKKSGKKTLIVDFDAHHGNGTEDIFRHDKNTVYISLHHKDIYPNTGRASYDNIYNMPLEYNCGDDLFLKTLYDVLDTVTAKSGFEQLAISAGFDGHINDPVASLGLSGVCYMSLGAMLRQLSLPSFFVLEGGYDPSDLARNIEYFIEGLI